MRCPYINKEGRLRDNYLPAMYFDANVLIHYFIAEEYIEAKQSGEDLKIAGFRPENRLSVLRKILRAEKYTQKMIEIVEKLKECPRVFPVYTPLSLAEVMKVYSKEKFKELATEYVGNFAIERKSDKQIGGFIKEIFNMRREEARQRASKDVTTAGLPEDILQNQATSDLELLAISLSLNHSFIVCNRFSGLILADIINFEFTEAQLWHEMSPFAYLQLDLSDMIHVITAKHLGCEYIASFDEDFARVSDLLIETTGIKVLTSPDMVMKLL
jgi:predicted nucleic acid-binding protein